MASDLDCLLRDLRRRKSEGVELKLGNGGHYQVRLHGRLIATLPLSPSDHRAIRNVCQELAKAGVCVHMHTKRRPPKKKIKA